MFPDGVMCRSKEPIIRRDNDDEGRLCRIVGVVPEHRWRTPGIPEYKVELVALPVVAFRRHHELTVVPASDAMLVT